VLDVASATPALRSPLDPSRSHRALRLTTKLIPLELLSRQPFRARSGAGIVTGVSPDPCLLSAVEQAGMLRRGELTAVELVTAHLARIERVNPPLNAIVTLTPERALAAAAQADTSLARGGPCGPLHGLPIAHKDLLDTAAVRTTYGSPAFRDHVPTVDALLVERLRDAGAIMVGKTNTPEWGAGSHTFNPVFGATRNPWDARLSAGGSSGGAAVAVACRMVSFADGSDLGGSLRNPAAWNGVVGLRPTPGLVPSWPTDAPWLPFAIEGPIARTAADVALLLGAMMGADRRAPMSLHAQLPDLTLPLDAELDRRRVAWSPSLGGLPVDSDVLDVLRDGLPLLAEVGLEVVEAAPDLSGADAVFETWRAFMFALSLGDLLDRDPQAVKPTVRWNIERGRALTGADLLLATRLHAELGERVRSFFERHDYLACPVTQVSPFAIEIEYPQTVSGIRMGSYLEWMRSCSRITSTGCPAVSVPIGVTPSGLPVGLQVVAAPGGERALLELAHALERATGLADRLPSSVPRDVCAGS
jgi:amidase